MGRRLIRVFAICATAGTAALAFGSAGSHAAAAGTGSALNLSSAQAIDSYLSSHGVNPASAIRQSGLLNYAGPSCPGLAWTCAPSTAAVVQQAPLGGINVFDCEATAAARCLVVQVGVGPLPGVAVPSTATSTSATSADAAPAPPAPGDNKATCHENLSDTSATAIDCMVVQTSASGHNQADFNQQWQQKSTDAQAATETAEVTQTNGTGKNDAHVQQQIQQQINDAASTQDQEAVQQVCVQQDSATGDNHADVNQQQNQNEQSNAPGVTQTQNSSPGSDFSCGPGSSAPSTTISPNLGALVEQDQQTPAATGKNDAGISQQLSEQQQAQATTGFSQQDQGSGPSNGGLEGSMNQTSTGQSQANGNQQEHQTTDTEAASYNQEQFDPARCCSNQVSNPNDHFSINQQLKQDADPGAFQEWSVTANCNSSGSCSAQQNVNVDGQQQPSTCSTTVNSETGTETETCDSSGAIGGGEAS